MVVVVVVVKKWKLESGVSKRKDSFFTAYRVAICDEHDAVAVFELKKVMVVVQQHCAGGVGVKDGKGKRGKRGGGGILK